MSTMFSAKDENIDDSDFDASSALELSVSTFDAGSRRFKVFRR